MKAVTLEINEEVYEIDVLAVLRHLIQSPPTVLAKEHQQVLERLGSMTAEAQRLRTKLRETADELTAKKVEADGLRMRACAAEANVRRMMNQHPAGREREQALGNLGRLMSTRPGAFAANGADA